MRSRRFLAPEVVQSSAMDCGPAALKCLCEGFGLPISYDRLREACQTDLDGTSIDTLEKVAVSLGLEAEQVMLPLDHLLLPQARSLPALLVVTNPLGLTHFLVAWRRHGPWVQLMDPAIGRSFKSAEDLLAETYVHTLPVPASAWREWAGSPEFLGGLAARMGSLGIRRTEGASLVADALDDPGWRSIAALDAAVRTAASLVQSGGVRRGREARELVDTCFRQDRGVTGESVVPEHYWSVGAGPDTASGQLLLRGAVLLRVRGRTAGKAGVPELSPELRAALAVPSTRPLLEAWRQIRADGWLTPVAVVAALAVAAGTTVVEALFFRGLLDLAARLGLPEQRLAAVGALLLFLGLGLAFELSVVHRVLALGRRLEIGLRLRFLAKIARLGDRYFRSRLSSDMAERCHGVYRLRLLPELAANFLRSGFQLASTAIAIVWLDPTLAPLAVLAAGLAFAVPLAAQPVLTERDLRLRNHAGALGRFSLDGLLGLVPLRNHGAGLALRREHEGLLCEWVRAALRFESTTVVLDLLQALSGYGLAVWLVVRHVSGTGEVGQALLLCYWAIQIQMLGQQMDIAARQYPLLKNTAIRLLEPLGAETPPPREGGRLHRDSGRLPPLPAADGRRGEEGRGEEDRGGEGRVGVALRFEGVSVVASGHVILEGIDLDVEPGSRVAVVGRSGAGKSSLVGLLLGWHPPSTGQVSVDGEPLTPERLESLRRDLAWVDPAVQLWNASLFDNLRYGALDGDRMVGPAVEASLLRSLLHELPSGLQTSLGEGGGLVSGGEGQRVRFGRALLRDQARLVLLDEPFRGLDRGTRAALLDRARSWWPRATLLCVTHDVEQTLSFDQVVVLEGGHIVEAGTPGVLAARPAGRYRGLLDREARVRRRFESEPGWRRLRIVPGGRIEEQG